MINVIQKCNVKGRLEYRYYKDNSLFNNISIKNLTFYFRFDEYITINKIIFIKCSKI